MRHIDAELDNLPFPALLKLAEWHDVQATIVRAHALRLQEQAEGLAKVDRRLKQLDLIPDTIIKYLRQGRTLAVAQDMAAHHLAAPPATIARRWHDFITYRAGRDMAKRNRLIMALAETGLKNEQIAARVGLHPNSVSRIISQERRRRLCFERRDNPAVAVLDDARKPEKGPNTALLSNT